MKKLFLTLLLSILALTSFAPQAYAKVWTKELVDKVMLESGYKFSICTINMPYDRSNSADNIFNAQEKDFEANPDSFPCNKQSQEDVLFADITLYFNRAKWGDVSAPEKLIEFQNHLYSVDEYGDVLADPNGKTDIKDIAAFDWFSTIPTIHGVRGTRLINTDPNATEDQKTLPNSNFLIIHDPATGKFSTALFVFNNNVYKFSSMISQVTIPATLVDYTQSEVTTPTSVPIVTSTPEPTSIPTPTINEMANWKTYIDTDYPFQIKYPNEWTLRTTYGNSVKNIGSDRVAGIDINTGTPGYGSVLVVNVINPQGKNLEDWLRLNMSNAYIPTKTTFQGSPAYRYSFPTQSNRLDTIEIYYQYKDKIIFLAWNLISGVDQPTADQIMSTLKFTQ